VVAETVPAGDSRLNPPLVVQHADHCVPALAHLYRITASDGTESVWCGFCSASVTRRGSVLWEPQL
jgi:hypothetical protein